MRQSFIVNSDIHFDCISYLLSLAVAQDQKYEAPRENKQKWILLSIYY